MERIAANGPTKDIIQKHGFKIKKRYGQNFIVNPHALGKIMADISPNDFVIEIGPGIGGLTQPLCECAKRVAAIEIDATLIPILQETLHSIENIAIIQADALHFDFRSIIGDNPREHTKIVANLPYYITTPIIMTLLEQRLPIHSITVMVQKEVAQRLCASPGTKDYGAITPAVLFYSQPELIANVPRNCFIPRPNVDSAVVRLLVRERPPIETPDEPLLFAIIKSAFSKRRKTLQNCLTDGENKMLSTMSITKEHVKSALLSIGKDQQTRGETLSLSEFAALTNALYAMFKD